MEIRRRARVPSRGSRREEGKKRGMKLDARAGSASSVSIPPLTLPPSTAPRGAHRLAYAGQSGNASKKSGLFLKVFFCLSLALARSLAQLLVTLQLFGLPFSFRIFFSIDHSDSRSRLRLSLLVMIERRAWREIGVSAGGRNKVKEVGRRKRRRKRMAPSSLFFCQTRWRRRRARKLVYKYSIPAAIHPHGDDASRRQLGRGSRFVSARRGDVLRSFKSMSRRRRRARKGA